MYIEEMKKSDFDLIKNNLKSDFDDFWNESILKLELENESRKYIVAKDENEILGFAGISYIFDEAELMNIVVKKDKRQCRYRKSFIGKNN